MAPIVRIPILVSAIVLVFLPSNPSPAADLPTASPEEMGMSSERLGRLAAKMQSHVDDN